MVVFLVAVWPLALCLVFLVLLFLRTRRAYLFFVTCLWGFAFFYVVLDGLAQLFLDPVLSFVSYLFLIPVPLWTEFGSDLQLRESVDTVKVAIAAVTGTAMLFIMMSPHTFAAITLSSGEQLMTFSETFRIAVTLHSAIGGIFNLPWGIRTIKQSPKGGKRYPRILYLVAFVGFTSIFLVYGLNLMQVIPGIISLAWGIPSLLFILAFAKEPRLGYFPPRALRLVVVDTVGGIPLFTHTWRAGEEIADEDLFSGMVQGISLILRGSIKKGNMREIRLEEATLILQPVANTSLACVLVASRASQTLRDDLRRFAQRFFEEFSSSLGAVYDTKVFAPAEALIKECFPFFRDAGAKVPTSTLLVK